MTVRDNNNPFNTSETNLQSADMNDTFAGLVPVGSVVSWAKTLSGVPQTLSSNFVECDGSVLSDATSPLNGVTIPDLNGDNRFMRGSTTSGATGGEDTHVLTDAEMPNHTHGIGRASGNSVTTNYGRALNGFTSLSGDIVTSSAGSGAAHENRPPYYEIVWIMRIK